MTESHTGLSSQETIIDPDVVIRLEERIQNWMRETAFLTNSLQDIPPSNRKNIGLSIKKWLREQKEIEGTALVTQLLQSMLSSAEANIGSNFHLEKKAQDSKQSNKRICKAPETSNVSGRKEVKAYVVQAADKLWKKDVLIEASGKMPEVRLVIKSPYIRSKFLETPAKNIRYPSRKSCFKYIFGVVQDTVDYTVKLDLRFDTCMEPFSFWCDVVYDPFSDGCYLHNHSELSIYLFSHGGLQPEHTISCEKRKSISGAWRISVKQDQTTSCFYPIFDILVRDKLFNISAENDNKVPTVLGTNLFPRDTQIVQYTTTSMSRTRTSILDLADGETVYIKDLHDDKGTYHLERVKEIASSSKTCVFSCRHSENGIVVAKVYRFDKKHQTHERLKREMEILKSLNHENIVSLIDADPRVFALYLEQLPPSLDKNRKLEYSWADAKTILFDISSALSYLSKRAIIHYDIKPANIAFCRKRGAILFDFDLCGYSTKPENERQGGTFRFLPPETIESGNIRGGLGDVWALGVTILWIMEMDTDSSNVIINMKDLYKPDSFTYQMVEKRLWYIALQRGLLDLEDKVQALVYDMLEPTVEARVTAAAIHKAISRMPESGRSTKKRK